MKTTTITGWLVPALFAALWLLGSVPAHAFSHSVRDTGAWPDLGSTDGNAPRECDPVGATVHLRGVHHVRFSTKCQANETDLFYYGYRYYNASTGRWLSRDPVAVKGFTYDLRYRNQDARKRNNLGERHDTYLNCENDLVSRWDYLGLISSCPKTWDGLPCRGQGGYIEKGPYKRAVACIYGPIVVNDGVVEKPIRGELIRSREEWVEQGLLESYCKQTDTYEGRKEVYRVCGGKKSGLVYWDASSPRWIFLGSDIYVVGAVTSLIDVIQPWFSENVFDNGKSWLRCNSKW